MSIHLCVDSVHDRIVVLRQHSWACDPYEDIGHVLTVDIPQLNVAWWTNPDSKVYGANMGPRLAPWPLLSGISTTCESLFVNRLNKMDWYATWGWVNEVLFINFSTKDIFIYENISQILWITFYYLWKMLVDTSAMQSPVCDEIQVLSFSCFASWYVVRQGTHVSNTGLG